MIGKKIFYSQFIGRKSIKALVNNNITFSCLVINPGPLYSELLKDELVKRRFNFIIWDESSKDDLKFILTPNYDFILIDNSNYSKISYKNLFLINSARMRNYPIYDLVYFFEYITGRIPILTLSDEWFINQDILTFPVKFLTFTVKRTIDLILSILFLPIIFFFISISFFIVKFTSPGPFFFIQERIGKNGRKFMLYKIRTMVHNKNQEQIHTVENDQRIFPFGFILRKTKIDELPQIFNILKGDMSFIGPRPEQSTIVEQLSNENPYYQLRHIIRPGLSGWAQVHQPKATPQQNLEKLEYDLYYIKNINIILEVKILIKTMKVIFTLNSL